MIYLKKGQTLFDNPSMVVYDPTGYYDDGTSVICAPVFAPEEPVCRYEAKYIAYGGMVYSISDEEELLKQVLEIDPQSLFGKDSKQVAVDKAADTIVTQGTSQTPDEDSKIESKEVEKEIKQAEEKPTTAPPTDILSGNTSATTPPTVDAATTTPTIETPQSPDTPTPVADVPPTITPPEDLLPTDTASSTQPIDVPSIETIQSDNTASSTVTE